MNKHASLLPAMVLFTAACLWGISWLPLKTLNAAGISGIPLILLMNLFLVLVITPIIFKQLFVRQHAKKLLAISFFGGLAIFSITYALIYGDVIRVIMLFYLLPVWGVLGGRLFLGEDVDAQRWLGVFAAILGAFLVLGGFAIFQSTFSWIDVAALLSGLFFATNNILFRSAQAIPLGPKMLSMFFGCAFLSGSLLLLGIEKFPVTIATSAWAWLIVYTLIWSLLANVAMQWAVVRLEAGQSSIILTVELVVAVISAMLIRGESPDGLGWLGCALIFTATLMEVRKLYKTN